MAKVAISAEFLVAFAKVPRKVQKKVREFTEKFLHDPTQASINYESIHGMKDPKVRTVRVGLDYRAIVLHPPKGDVYVCVWVDHHDEAMEWARRKRFEVNPTVGSFQIYEVEESEIAPPGDVDSEMGDAPLAEDRLLSGRTLADLRLCGVPELLLPSVCGLKTDADLESVKHYLPAGIGDTLTMLASGYSVEEAIRESARAHAVKKAVDPDDFEAAMAHPITRRRFRLLQGEGDLDELLGAPHQKTRTFVRGRTDAVFADDDDGAAAPIEVEVDGTVLDRSLENGERWVFGRELTCDVVIENSFISRRQFAVRNADGQAEVKPFPSKNEVRILGHRSHEDVFDLGAEVRIRVADTQVVLRRSG